MDVENSVKKVHAVDGCLKHISKSKDVKKLSEVLVAFFRLAERVLFEPTPKTTD